MADTAPDQTAADRPMGILDDPNEDRALQVSLDGRVYARHPVRTHLVTASDDAPAVVARYAAPLGDDVAFVAVSERMVAITQGRSYPMTEIQPGWLARFLVRFVTRPGYGIGLGTPQTLQLAIDEVGAPRILLAAAVSGITKPFGVHGLFYRIAGPQAAAIDGPTSYTIARTTRRPRSVPAIRTALRRGSPRPSAYRSRSSMPTMPAATCWAKSRSATRSTKPRRWSPRRARRRCVTASI